METILERIVSLLERQNSTYIESRYGDYLNCNLCDNETDNHNPMCPIGELKELLENV